MATIEQYASGKAAKAVRLAYDMMRALDRPLPETELAAVFNKEAEALAPLLLKMPHAEKRIEKARVQAVGDRVCRCAFPGTPATRAVFLDELAVAMVEAGRAEYVPKQEAGAALQEHPGRPLVVSKVSGKYMEICRTWPDGCFYWNLEKRGLRCLARNKVASNDPE